MAGSREASKLAFCVSDAWLKVPYMYLATVAQLKLLAERFKPRAK